ncbi:MAG: hypothetical protein KDN05_23025 [Verrucomicrobiae bacterium]|nr:hypothetical protein [Verrucomicrobiae bacterium]
MIATVLYLAHGTDRALFFMRNQRASVHERASRKNGLWLPKSQIRIVQQAPAQAWHWAECVVLMPQWLAKRHDLAPSSQKYDPDDQDIDHFDPGPFFEQA